IGFELPGTLSVIRDAEVRDASESSYPLFSLSGYLEGKYPKHADLNFLQVSTDDFSPELETELRNNPSLVLVLQSNRENALQDIRSFFARLIQGNLRVPVIIRR